MNQESILVSHKDFIEPISELMSKIPDEKEGTNLQD